jgi:hypothetical protein
MDGISMLDLLAWLKAAKPGEIIVWRRAELSPRYVSRVTLAEGGATWSP